MKKQKPFPRSSGILFPVFSLPSQYPTGTFGSEAYRFIDFLHDCGQSYWQILPLSPTGYGNSPYQSFSAFAGSHIYISPDMLPDNKNKVHCKKNDYSVIDYDYAFKKSSQILKKAFLDFNHSKNNDFSLFCTKNDHWLENYAEFMAFKKYFDNKPWYKWDDKIKFRDKSAMRNLKKKLSEEILYHKFCQYEFYRQWFELKKYANKKNVKIIGDIPIYVSYDSADVWTSPGQFLLDSKLDPVSVAGVPPDIFSQTGQLWGNPIYNWQTMHEDNFRWWRNRISHSAELFDVIRIDHFIGIVNFYSIPYRNTDALGGVWIKGPGEALIKVINESRGNTAIIAEDLGPATKEVKKLLKKSGYPGMKLMEFAFDSVTDNENLPHRFDKNTVVYGGTHDNETLCGYFKNQKKDVINFAKSYLNVNKKSEIPYGIIRSAHSSCADLVIFQLQDYLNLDNHSRINIPSTVGENWCYRLPENMLTKELSEKIKNITRIYGRKGEYR